jgi:phosphatidyl-myo-inositol dimannoside synthase
VSRKPTMLAIVPDAFGGRGGISQYNRDFFETLAEMDLMSVVILPRGVRDPYCTPKNIRQITQRCNKVSYSVAAISIALLNRVDIVFCGHLFMAPLAAFIAQLKGAKLIVQTHGIEAWPKATRQQRIAVESADLVLSVSRQTRAAVLSWAALPPERVIVLPNTAREEFSPGDGSKMRAVLGVLRKVVLLTVARMDSWQPYKGQDRVIAAIPRLLSMGHDVHYLVVGEGDDRSRMEALARDQDVRDRVHFLGPVSTQELTDIYRAADLYVMPSSGEGFGIAFLEAMMSGTPAIGLDIAGTKDVLANGELGLCVQENDFEDAIHRALSRPQPHPNALAAAARVRFGRKVFALGVRTAVSLLQQTA